MNRRLKKSVVYSLYGISFTLLLGGVILLGIASKQSISPVYDYVSKSIFDYEEVKVVNAEDKLIRPYTDNTVKIVKEYYDYKGEETSQENSLIYYENTYIQSSGVSYSNGNTFEVISVLDGTVTNVKEDKLLGKIVEVSHNNEYVSIYQSLSDIKVKKDNL